MLQKWSFDRKSARHLLILLVVILPLFIYNGRWGESANGDTIAVALPSWKIATEATMDLTGSEIISRESRPEIWYVEDANGRTVSNRPPGLIALAVPAYAVTQPDRFTNGPATAVALLLTSASIVISWVVFSRLVDQTFATAAAITLALGTTTWAISAAELWPHGPDQLWAALAILALSAGSYPGAGVAFALSVTTRPIMAVAAAATGLLEGWRRRSWRPLVQIGAIALIGLLIVVIYNQFLYSSWSITGGYPESFTTGALERFSLGSYVSNLATMFVGPRLGVLVTSPILGISTYAAVRFRRSLPAWSKSAVLAGLVYLLVHAGLNRASGGLDLFYRYPLEAIVLASPALLVGAYELHNQRILGRVLIVGSAGLSIALQVLHVFYLSCFITDPVIRACILQ